MRPVQALRDLTASFDSADMLALCYHRIRSRERFAAQMRFLAERAYTVLPMEQFIERFAHRQPAKQPAVLLTFDTCHSEQLEDVVRVLKSFNCPATFFPLSRTLDPRPDGLQVQTQQELLDLVQSGHTIGCHTHSHLDLTVLGEAELYDEVVGSKRILEEALGHRITAFCYPYGTYNARVVSVVREAGFQVAFTVDLGGVGPGDDLYRLKRVPVLGEPEAGEFAGYLSGTVFLSGSILLYWKLRERRLDRQERWAANDL